MVQIIIALYLLSIPISALCLFERTSISQKMLNYPFPWMAIYFVCLTLWPIGYPLHKWFIKRHGGSWQQQQLARLRWKLDTISLMRENLPEDPRWIDHHLKRMEEEMKRYEELVAEQDKQAASRW